MTIRIPPKTKQDALDSTAALEAAGVVATTTEPGSVLQGAAVADSVAADVPAMVADFNLLLASLRAAGIIATE